MKTITATILALALATSAASAQFMDRRSPGQQALDEAMAELEEATAPLLEADAQAKAKLIRDYAKAVRNPVVQWYMRGGQDLPPQQQPQPPLRK